MIRIISLLSLNLFTSVPLYFKWSIYHTCICLLFFDSFLSSCVLIIFSFHINFKFGFPSATSACTISWAFAIICTCCASSWILRSLIRTASIWTEFMRVDTFVSLVRIKDSTIELKQRSFWHSFKRLLFLFFTVTDSSI